MTNQGNHTGIQTLAFFVVGAIPVGVALWVLAQSALALEWGIALVLTTALVLLVGTLMFVNLLNRLHRTQQEMGNQARRLQESNLEIERLNYEFSQANRLRRNSQRQQEDQNRAILQVAEQFELIARDVRSKAEEAGLDEVSQQRIRSLHGICHDLVELLNVQVAAPYRSESFVADQLIHTVVEKLKTDRRLPESFTVQGEDTDISAEAPEGLFRSTIEVALAGMAPFSTEQPLSASMISYQHAELGNVLQFVVRSQGVGINAVEGHEWFSHFQMHTDEAGHYLGPGLSMMLIQQYVDRLGGKARISVEEQGSLTLTLTLPLRPDDTSESAPELAAEH